MYGQLCDRSLIAISKWFREEFPTINRYKSLQFNFTLITPGAGVLYGRIPHYGLHVG